MKKLLFTSIFALLFAVGNTLTAQNQPEEYLGLPGDNLNLYAVMNLFQESETLEGFERSLNDPESLINNLDLNNDNLVDYIMVFDYKDDNVHSIVLRVALNPNEFQDVAVFTVEIFSDGSVMIQLVGDEALYGPNYIVEPVYAETPNPGYRGNGRTQKNVTVVHTTYEEVASWPVIVYISQPTYSVWHSSWHWGYYPSYWSPWTPHYYHYYYGYHYNWHNHYYSHYRPWRHHRCDRYHTVYHTNIRNHSSTVVVNVNNGRYRNTYSKPEKRREGEVLFAERHPGGIPERVRTDNRLEGRRGDGNTSPGRVKTDVEPAAVGGNSRESGRQSIDAPGNQNDRVRTPNNERNAAVRENNASRPADGNENRRNPAVNSGSEDRNPARNVQSPRPERRSPREQATTPARNNAPVRTERTAPERSSRPATTEPAREVRRPEPARESNRPSQPAQEIRRPEPARESSRPSQPAPEVRRPEPARESSRPSQPAPEVRRPEPARESSRPSQPAPEVRRPEPVRESSRPAAQPSPPVQRSEPAREPSRPSSPPPQVRSSENSRSSETPARRTESIRRED